MRNQNKTPKQTMIIAAGASLDSASVPYTPVPRSKRALIGGIVAIIITVAFFGLAIWAIATTRSNIAERDKLIETGLRAEGTATGKSASFERRISKYSRKTVYHAYYSFTKQDGTRSSTYGDKDYDTPEEIRAGMKATVHYYDERGSKTAVTDEE